MSPNRRLRLPILLALLLVSGGCYGMKKSSGGGQTTWNPPRKINTADVLLPPGYRIEAVARDLNLPTAVTFDADGRPYVTEAGYSYGELFTTPRLLRVNDNGTTAVVATGDHAPWTGIRFHDGAFYVAQGAGEDGGRIVRITPDGQTTVLVDRLPSVGDHHTNGPVIRDGYVYFAVGTATNSGVVGTDNYKFGWLQRHPTFHDIPARDVTLAGHNFTTKDPFNMGREVTTGAFVPFGTQTREGQVIRGRLPATGAIMRIPLTGGGQSIELVAWGLRNPYGLAFAPDGTLYCTENQFDARGSRPIWGTGDLLWRIEPGMWYGWPDFHAGHPVENDDMYAPRRHKGPRFLLTKYPNVPPKPAAVFGVHSSSNGLDFSTSEAFGHAGQAFVAQFGDMAPGVGRTMQPVGFQVVRADVGTGVVHAFATNKGDQNAPASYLRRGGLERPVDAKFSPDGDALYVVDFGVMTTGKNPQPRENTGVLWRITRDTPAAQQEDRP